MKNPIIIEVLGDAVSKQAFKFTVIQAKGDRKAFAIPYKEEEVKVQEKLIKKIAEDVKFNTNRDDVFTKAVEMKVIVFKGITKTLLNNKKRLALCLSGKLLPDVKPDFDNITKLLADALEKVVYLNDGQVCKYYFEKYYSLKPRTIIMIEEIDLEKNQGSEEERIENLKQQELNFIDEII